MERKQFKAGRYYQTEEGVWVPSVTTILNCWPKGEEFSRWLGNSASYEDAIAKRDEAGERGTLVHESIETLLAGGTVTLPEDVDPKVPKLIQGFINFWRDKQPKVIATELFVVGDGYAGTADCLCEIDDEVWLLDWKSSAGVYTSYFVQLAAYAVAIDTENSYSGRPERTAVVHLKTSTKRGYQLVESDCSIYEDYEAFLACMAIFQREHGLEPEPIKEKEDVPLVFCLESITEKEESK